MTAYPQVVCGYRERTTSGLKECIAAPDHQPPHYLVPLVQYTDRETA